MDGDTTVDPDSGLTAGRTLGDRDLCRSDASAPAQAPAAPTCPTSPYAGHYDGVRGQDQYYEPESSTGAPANDVEDGDGYSPSEAENQRDTGRKVAVEDHPGLFEAANRPFEAHGLRAGTGTGDVRIPWYSVFGNHDGLIQGNAPRTPAFEAYAVGCAKVTALSEAQRKALQSAPSRDDGMQMAAQALLDNATKGGLTTVVPPDPRRRPLRKAEFIAEHFHTGGIPVGHGFEYAPEPGMGYYAFDPKPGIRFVVLDTISEHGLEGGNLDDTQFRWLHRQLAAAESANKLVLVFAHHSIRTMGQPPASPFAPGDGYLGSGLDPNVHFGDGPRETGIRQPCRTNDPAADPYPTETLRCLLLRHKGAIAFVNGHEHNNRIEPFREDPQDTPGQPGASGRSTPRRTSTGRSSRA